MKNFKNYNVFSNEDGKIIFDKLKEIIDAEEKVEKEHILKNEEGEKIKSVDNYAISTEKLEDGSIKVHNPTGYTILKDGVIVKVYDANEELKKVEEQRDKTKNKDRLDELDKKLENIDKFFLEKKEKKPERKKELAKEKKIKEDEMVNDVNKLIKVYDDSIEEKKEKVEQENIKEENEIEEVIKVEQENIKEEKEIEEVINENESIKKEEDKKVKVTLYGIDEFELLDAKNFVFLMDTFSEVFEDRKNILLKSLMDYNNLFDEENELLFVDIDLEKETLYIDVNFFLVLVSKFFKDSDGFLKILTYSKEAINIANLKRLIIEINASFTNGSEIEIFKTVGKKKTPFIQRNIKYKVENEKFLSCQMLLLNLNNDNEIFNKLLNEIKNNIISKFKPVVNRVKMTDDNSKIISIDLNTFEI